MIIKINQMSKTKEIHLEYPGSYWEVMHQTGVRPKKKSEKKALNFFGFNSLFSFLMNKGKRPARIK